MRQNFNQKETKQNEILPDSSTVLFLMKKRILLNSSEILYNQMVTSERLAKDWTVHHSEWKVENDWLVGENRGNWPGMAILKQDFPGNVLVEYKPEF